MKEKLYVWVAVIALLLGVCGVSAVTTKAVDATDAVSNTSLVKIDGPIVAKAGQLIVLDVSKSNATSFTWVVEPPTANFLVIDGGKRAVFSHGSPGEFLFIVAGAKDGEVGVTTHRIKVEGGQPPFPNVDGIAAKIPLWCESVVSDNKKDEALKLAQSFASVASIVDSGVVMTPEDVVLSTKNANRDALGENINKWVPLLEALQGELKSMSAAGTLSDTASHAKVWRDIAEGLRQYANTL